MMEKLREHIPLQQGLRLWIFRTDWGWPTSLREHIPLQQGLRQWRCDDESVKTPQRAYSITTRIKTAGGVVGIRNGHGLREHIPLQQGLRLLSEELSCPCFWSSESIFHYNKD